MRPLFFSLLFFGISFLATAQTPNWVKYENEDITMQFPKRPFDTTMNVGKISIRMVGIDEATENFSITRTRMSSKENYSKKSANDFYKDMLDGVLTRSKGTSVNSKLIESADGHQALDASYLFQANNKTYKANNIFVLTDNDVIYRFMHVFLVENEPKLKQNNSSFFDSIKFKKKFLLN